MFVSSMMGEWGLPLTAWSTSGARSCLNRCFVKSCAVPYSYVVVILILVPCLCPSFKTYFYLCVCHVHACAYRDHKKVSDPSTGVTWGEGCCKLPDPGAELKSSVRAVSADNHQAISPGLPIHSGGILGIELGVDSLPLNVLSEKWGWA